MANFHRNETGGGFIVGNNTGEAIDAVALAPDAGADDTVDIIGGDGNDTITGHAGHNYVDAGAGDDAVATGDGADYVRATTGSDTVDGGAGADVLSFNLATVTGDAALGHTVGTDGVLTITLDGNAIFTVTNSGNGAYLVTGVPGTVGEAFGTEAISGIERLDFNIPGGSMLFVTLAPQAFHYEGQEGGWVTGSVFSDTIDLGEEFSGIVGSDDGSWVQGAGTDAGAGDDQVTGTAGADYIFASAGADTVAGGGGSDTLHIRLDGDGGALARTTGASGEMLLTLDGTTIATVARNADGTVLVTGIPGTAGEGIGTETLSGIEYLSVSIGADNMHVNIEQQVFRYTGNNGGWVAGSDLADNIDLAATFTGITGSNDGSWANGAGANGGDGNDTITGTAGADYILASAGDDTIDGGANDFDTVAFHVDAWTGKLTHAQGADGAVNILLDGTIIAAITRNGDGSYTVTGVAGTAGEAFGTESVTNVETLQFSRPGLNNESANILNFSLAVQVHRYADSDGGYVTGSDRGEIINLGELFPLVEGSTDGSWVPGVGVDAGAGDDAVIGTAGSDDIRASAGNDIIDGREGYDSLHFNLDWSVTGQVTTTVEAGVQLIQLDGATIATITRNSDGSHTVAGVAGTPGEAFGNETLFNVENAFFTTRDSMVHVTLGTQVHYNTFDDGGWVSGSALGDSINLGAIFGAIGGSEDGSWSPGAGADAGGGDDTVAGTAGADHILASAGNDIVDGGANSHDNLVFNIESETGALSYSVNGGTVSILLGGTAIATVASNGDGSYTVTGIDGTAGAKFGTEHITNIEWLQFNRPGNGEGDHGSYLQFALQVQAHHNDFDNGGWVNGSALDDYIDLAAIFTGITESTDGSWTPGAYAHAGSGNDSVDGTAGNDNIQASEGDDTVDGGAGMDNMHFDLSGVAGELTQGTHNGAIAVMLDGAAIITIERNDDGSFTLTGLAGTEGEKFGTEHIDSIEWLYFGGRDSYLHMSLDINVFRDPNGNGGWVGGSTLGDNIDLGAIFTGIEGSTDGSWVQGAGVDAGDGDDTVTGTAGADHILASAGDDTVDGGDNNHDNLVFNLDNATGALSYSVSGDTVSILLAGTAIATVVSNGDGSYTVTGIDGTAGAKFGTEHITNIERLQFNRFGNGEGDNGSFLQFALQVQVHRNDFDNGGYVTGSGHGDAIDLAALFPLVKGSTDGSWAPGVGVDAGAGDDTVTGTAGSDDIQASAGDDVIDGGAGHDSMHFNLDWSITGEMTTTVENGVQLIQLDGLTIATITRNEDGSHTVAGVAGTPGASFGTERLTSIENAFFTTRDSLLHVTLGVQAHHNTGDNGGWVNGTALDDSIDLATIFTGITESTDGSWTPGAYAHAGSGNDTVSGTAGYDNIQASEGDDTVDGRAGMDNMHFDLSGVAGELTQGTHNGAIAVMLDGAAIITIERNDDGSFTLTGLAGTAGEKFGTEHITSIEWLYFGGQDSYLHMSLDINVFRDPNGNGGWVGGSTLGDNIDLGAIFTGIEGSADGSWSQGAGVGAGDGDDTITGTAGADHIVASAGNDIIDGGASNHDNLVFDLEGETGELSYSVSGDTVSILLAGTAIATMVSNGDGSYTVTGIDGTAGAKFGTEHITNVEWLQFNRHANGEGDNGSYLQFALQMQVHHNDFDNGGYVTGSSRGDAIDLAALFPLVEGSTDGSWAPGVGVNAGAGNDTVTGTAGSDDIQASAGNDVIDGGANYDAVHFNLSGPMLGALSTAIENGVQLILLDGVTIATIERNEDGSYTVAGVPDTAGAFYGTERLSNVENVFFTTPTDVLRVSLGMQIHRNTFDEGGWVSGTALSEQINLAEIFPGLTGRNDGDWTTGAGVDAGYGDDTIVGSAGSDHIMASEGNDTIDGGANHNDRLVFNLSATTGVLDCTFGENGAVTVRLNGVAIAAISSNGDGSYTVTGIAGTAGEEFGTENVTNVEWINFHRMPNGDDGSHLEFRLAPVVHHQGSGGFVIGTGRGEVIDLAALFPAFDGTQPDSTSADGGEGDDTLLGTAGGDNISGTAGDDVIDGRAGNDAVHFNMDVSVRGQLYAVFDGELQHVKLDGVTIATIGANADGSYTVTGTPGTPGAVYGTERLSNVETVFFTSADSLLQLTLGLEIHYHSHDNGGIVGGTPWSDNIDLAAIFPGITMEGSAGSIANAGHGDDTVLGTVGNDLIQASAGADVIDGRAGHDTVEIAVPRRGVLAQSTEGGVVTVLVDGVAIYTITPNVDGSHTLAGIPGSAGETVGTERLVSIESLRFIGIESELTLLFGLVVEPDGIGGGFVQGTVSGDNINLAGIFPNITGREDGDWTPGAAANGAEGDDTVIGTAGSDYILASAGNDTIDGGSNYNDRVVFHLPGQDGTLDYSVGEDGTVEIRLDGAAIATISSNSDGSYTVSGLAGTVGEQFGTEHLTSVEWVEFDLLKNGEPGSNLRFHVNVVVHENAHDTGGFVIGSGRSDVIDLAALFPALDGSVPPDGSPVPFASVDGGDGDDTVLGGAGHDNVRGSAGHDVFDGGAGDDAIHFNLDGAISGQMSSVLEDGVLLIQLEGVTIATIVPDEDGGYIVTGVAGTPGEVYGTERLNNVENAFFTSSNSLLHVTLGLNVYYNGYDNGGYVTGSLWNDTIDLAQIFPGIAGQTNPDWNPGAYANALSGDDTVLGTIGDDGFDGSEGNDTIDGRAGYDRLNFIVQAAAGELAYASTDTGMQVLLDGAAICNVVKNADGSYDVIGIAGTVGETFGTEHVLNIEEISFHRLPQGQDDQGSHLALSTTVQVYRNGAGNGGMVTGSSMSDVLDVQALFPDLTGSPDGSYAPGVWVDAGGGNDTVSGTLGSDNFQVSAGDDVTDGGGGDDYMHITVGNVSEGALTQEIDEDGVLLVKLGGVVVVTAVGNPDGSVTVTGMPGTGAEYFGTERISNIENLFFNAMNDNGNWAQLHVRPTVHVGRSIDSPTGWVEGSIFNDVVDLAQLFPGIEGNPNGGYVPGSHANLGAGNDSASGSAGADTFVMTEGSDVYDGRGGSDTIRAHLAAGTTGVLSHTITPSGTILVTLDGVPFLTVQGSGSTFTVSGIPGTVGESIGTERITNIERLEVELPHADGYSSDWYSINLIGQTVHAPYMSVSDTVFDDTINVPGLFPEVVPLPDASYVPGVNIHLSAGNDTVTGSLGNDYISASAGDDVLDGGAGNDRASFQLFEHTGVLSSLDDGAGTVSVMLNGVVIATVTQADGAILVAGVAGTAGEAFGTETLRSIERLEFYVSGEPDSGNYLSLNVGAEVYHTANAANGSVNGSLFDDAVDLSVEFPDVLPLGSGANVNLGGGDDTVTGSAGRDTIHATAGDDVTDGGASTDQLRFTLPSDTTGALAYSVVNGQALVTLDGLTILSITERGDGSYLVSGVPGTAGERFGTETITSIETVLVSRSGSPAVSIPLREELHNVADNGGRFTGSFGNDTIDIPSRYPLIVANDAIIVPGVVVNGGWGDDTITGSAGRDVFVPSAGDDVIDGGASNYDYMSFTLRTSDTGQITTHVGEDGVILVKRDAETIFTVRENSDGSFTLTGMPGTEGEIYGTETVRDVEVMYFNRSPATMGNNGSYLTLGLEERIYSFGTQPVYHGTFKSNLLDLGAAFPGIVASTDGTPVNGVFSEPDHGDDTVIGSAGNDIVIAGAGNDMFTGGAGWDRLVFDFTELPEILPVSAFSTVRDANGDMLVQVLGQTILQFHRQDDGSVLITGVGMAAEFGTEVIGADVEEVAIDYLEGEGAQVVSYFSLNMGPDF